MKRGFLSGSVFFYSTSRMFRSGWRLNPFHIQMANTESSVSDRLSRARTMQAHIEGFTPAFEPSDSALEPAAFETFLDAIEEANDDVSEGEVNVSDAADSRRAAAAEVQAVALRVKDYVRSNVNWKKYLASVASAANVVRGTHLPRKAAATSSPGGPGSTPPAVKKGGRSQQGYADIEKNFGKLIAALGKVTGYSATENSGLAIAALTTRRTAFAALNQASTDAESVLSDRQRIRLNYYEGETGLRVKMKAIKAAVRAQYGGRSNEYAAVKGIKL